MEEVNKVSVSPVREDITAVYIDKMLGKLRSLNLDTVIEKTFKIAKMVSLYGLYLATILGFISVMVIKFKLKAPFMTMLGIAIGISLGCLIIHYLSVKLLPEIKGFIKSENKLKFSSLLLDCFTVVIFLLAIGSLVFSLTGGSFQSFVMGFSTFVVFAFLGIFCIKTEELNIERTDGPVKASKQFEVIIAFFMRGFLAIIPVILFFGVIYFDILLLRAMFYKNPMIVATQLLSVLPVLLIPVIGYMTFILYAFTMDIYTSILSLPEKLDKK